MRLFLAAQDFGQHAETLRELVGINKGDRPKVKAEGYPDEVILEGLNLVSEYIAPHHSTKGHEEVSRRRKEMLDKDNVPYFLLNDSDVLVINGKQKKVLKTNPLN